MVKIDRAGLLPPDDHWPRTAYTLYSEHLREGGAGELLCSRHVMEVYRDSLIAFFLGCAGKPGFPRPPKRAKDLSDEDHAVDVVHDYFAKRAEQLIPKWVRFREGNTESPARHLRVFIRQDFRNHCRESIRSEQRYSGRARDLATVEFEAMDLGDELRRETTYREASALVRLALGIVLGSRESEADREDLLVLAENRVLDERPYEEFRDQLRCEIPHARQKVVRLKRKLTAVLRDLVREQGDTIHELLEDLS
jgi:hypothetical protein